jgi:phage terminase large subunit-like protein
MTSEQRDTILRLEEELARRRACPFRAYFPDEGPLRRELYPRSLIFWREGKTNRERLFLAANRTGKTVSAAYELTAHVTGDYPAWWEGRRFPKATGWWVAGDTRETTRDILQWELFGAREAIRHGTYSGMIPAHLIVDRTMKNGVADCLDTVWIRHSERRHGAPTTSTIQFKSYDQGRESFQGTSLTGGVWLDEEPPDASEQPTGGGVPSGAGDIYTECLLRTATTNGLLMTTLTPLRGLTPFIDHYLETSLMCMADGTLINGKEGMFGVSPEDTDDVPRGDH